MSPTGFRARFREVRWPFPKNKPQKPSHASQTTSNPQQTSRQRRSETYNRRLSKEAPEGVLAKYPPRPDTSGSSQGHPHEPNIKRNAGVPWAVEERLQTRHRNQEMQVGQQNQPLPTDERQGIGMQDDAFASTQTGFVSEVSASSAPNRSAQVATGPVPPQELATNPPMDGHPPQGQGRYQPNTYRPPAGGEQSINTALRPSQSHPTGDPMHDTPPILVAGNEVSSEKRHPPPQVHDDHLEQPRPRPDNGQRPPDADLQNHPPGTPSQSHPSQHNGFRGANTEARDMYVYSGAAGPRHLGNDAAQSQNAPAMSTVAQSELHPTASDPRQGRKRKVARKLSEITDAQGKKLTKGYRKVVGKRPFNPGTLKPLQQTPEPEARSALPTHAEADLRSIETSIRGFLDQRANRIPPQIPAQGPVIAALLAWLPRELDVWEADVFSLNGDKRVLEESVRTATQTARSRAREADALRRQLDQERNNVTHAHQELARSMGDVALLNDSIKQTQSANLELRRQINQTTKSFHGERATVQRLKGKLQEADATYRNDLALLNEELGLEKASREADRQALSEQLASQRSEFQQQREQEEKKHKHLVLRQRQMIASHEVENYRPIGDDVFQLSFQSIAQTIGNLLVLVPQPSNPGNGTAAEMDSTGFLARRMSVYVNGDSHPHGGGVQAWPRFFRSVCWRILVEGFFRDQPGFGVLGAEGEGYELLKSLREVFMQTSADGLLGEQPGLSDKESTAWRASFFAALLKEIRSPPSSPAQKRLPSLFHINVERVTGKLIDTMQGISGGRLDPRGPVLLNNLAHNVGVLALEMGAQRARLTLELARVGEKASGGGSIAWYRDEGGRAVGEEVIVDLATQPCLRKIGNGRSDTKWENIIVKGEIVSY